MNKLLVLAILFFPISLAFPRQDDAVSVPAKDEVRTAITELLERYNQALRTRDTALHRECFDMLRMYERAAALGTDPRLEHSAFREGSAVGLRLSAVAQGPSYAWDEIEIRRIDRRAEENDYVVLARITREDGERLFGCWWIYEADGAWRIWDEANLGVGLRRSDIAASGEGLVEKAFNLVSMIGWSEALAEEDLTEAEERIAWLGRDEAPDALQALHWLLKARILQERGELEDALSAVAEARRRPTHSPVANRVEATILLALGRPAEALEATLAFQERLGDDSSNLGFMGDALRELGRLEEAADAYRRGFADDPRDGVLLGAMALVMPAGEDAEVHEAFRALDAKAREDFLDCYLGEMIELGKLEQAYERCPDQADAFDTICLSLVEHKDADRLEDFVRRHRDSHPESGWLFFYAGQVHVLRNEVAAAVAEYDAGWRATSDAEAREVYRMYLVDGLYALGRAMEAYEEVGPRDDTFGQLVVLCAYEGNEAVLTALAKARLADAPGSADVPIVWGIVASWREEHESAVELLDGNLERFDPESPFIAFAEGALVLGAIYTNRLDLALRTAEASADRDGDPYFLALAHIVRDEPGLAIEAMERCVELGYEPQGFYDEPLLAELREGEAYEGFRRRHPPFTKDDGDPRRR